MPFPQIYDHEICAGEDYQFDLTFRDDQGVRVNLTGFTVSCFLMNGLQQLVAVADVQIPNPANGVAIFKFPRARTLDLAGVLRCVVRVFGETGLVQYAIDGHARIRRIEPVLSPTDPGDPGGGVSSPYFTATLSDLSNPSYYYYGGIVSGNAWKINRFAKTPELTKSTATSTANPTYPALEEAWAARSSLEYEGV